MVLADILSINLQSYKIPQYKNRRFSLSAYISAGGAEILYFRFFRCFPVSVNVLTKLILENSYYEFS